jgi:D-alanine-D-alanine ligase
VKKNEAGEVSCSDGGFENFDEGNETTEAETKLQQTKADTYAEWDTEETILAVKKALERNHEVTLIEANEEAYHKLLQAHPDIVFNIAEGMYGSSREAQIPAILEMLRIPYTGSDPITLGVCLDKSRAKEILTYYRIPTPPFAVVDSVEQFSSLNCTLPCIVKPLHEGSSKGIYDASVVRSKEELVCQTEKVMSKYNEPVLVEKFLSGREFTIAMLGNNSNLRMLPIIEIRFDSLPDGVNPIYSYEAKWIWDTIESPIDVHECPANIPRRLLKQIETICFNTYHVLRCRDWCRIDIRLDEQGIPNVLELNPLPGILPNPEEHSCFPQAARAAGFDYDALINTVLEAGARRYGLL